MSKVDPCSTGKQQHATAEDARRHLRSLAQGPRPGRRNRDSRVAARVNKARGAKLNVYRCPDCGFFHVGNTVNP